MSDYNVEMCTRKELDAINNVLTEAQKYGLQVEVIWSALLAMKSDPTISITKAMNEGFNEWVK